MGALHGQRAAAEPARWRHLSERVVGIFVARGSVVPVTEVDKAPACYASAGTVPGFSARATRTLTAHM